MARIVGSSYDSPRRLATLSAGSAAGVAPGQPVRSADGLIGRVIETGRWAARVMLVTDGASQRAGAAGPRRHAGARGRPRRRHDRAADPRGRPESVPARRHPRHLGRRRHLPAQHPGRVGDRVRGRHRDRAADRRSGADGFRDRPARLPAGRERAARSRRRRRRRRRAGAGPRRRRPIRASRTIRATSPRSSSPSPA